MYTEFYKLKEKPFSLTPDPEYLFLSRECEEALNHLIYGLKQKEGFILITGEVGTGKTTLCRALLEKIDKREFEIALILNPFLNESELLKQILEDFGEKVVDRGKKSLLEDIYNFLLRKNEEGKKVVIVIDEAQNLSNELLEELRILSNFETTKEKLLQIILFGQRELLDRLLKDDLRQLNQRISVRYSLAPLKKDEVARYIMHRLAIAGALGNISFTKGAVKEVFRFSAGIPRLVNLVCDRALLGAYIHKTSTVSRKIVSSAVKSLAVKGEELKFFTFHKPVYKYALSGAAAALLLFSVLKILPEIGVYKPGVQISSLKYSAVEPLRQDSSVKVQNISSVKKVEEESIKPLNKEAAVKSDKPVVKQNRVIQREKNFSIYYGSYRDKSNAISEMNKIKGYDSEVRISQVKIPDKGIRFWLLSGFYDKEEKAYEFGKSVIKKMNNKKYNISVVQVLKDKEG